MEILDLSDDPVHPKHSHTHAVTQILRNRPIVYILNHLFSPRCMTKPEQCLCEVLHINVWATADSFTNSLGSQVLLLSPLYKYPHEIKHICQLQLMYFRQRT